MPILTGAALVAGTVAATSTSLTSRSDAETGIATPTVGTATVGTATVGTGETTDADIAFVADPAKSVEAFVTVARVLRHQRCMNCHPSGDVPRVGDDRHLHLMNVERGPENHGHPAMNCSTCHQTKNQDVIGIPGAPHWSLAPRSMGWEGLDDHGLAEQLKDRTRNGDKSLEDLLHHVTHDALVLWGWQPDAGRTPIETPYETFIAAFETWIEHGAVSPAPGPITF